MGSLSLSVVYMGRDSVISSASFNGRSRQNPNYESQEDTSQYYIQSETGRVNFNVGGITHTVLLSSLYSTLPASRIGRLIRAKTRAEVLAQCDLYDPESGEYPTVYFDRNGS